MWIRRALPSSCGERFPRPEPGQRLEINIDGAAQGWSGLLMSTATGSPCAFSAATSLTSIVKQVGSEVRSGALPVIRRLVQSTSLSLAPGLSGEGSNIEV